MSKLKRYLRAIFVHDRIDCEQCGGIYFVSYPIATVRIDKDNVSFCPHCGAELKCS